MRLWDLGGWETDYKVLTHSGHNFYLISNKDLSGH